MSKSSSSAGEHHFKTDFTTEVIANASTTTVGFMWLGDRVASLDRAWLGEPSKTTYRDVSVTLSVEERQFVEWSRASLLSGSLSLDRPVGDGAWARPLAVEAHDDEIRWPVPNGQIPGVEVFAEVSSGPEMLTQFVGLGSADAACIAAFARRWGVLELCRHGLPAAHRPMVLQPALAVLPLPPPCALLAEPGADGHLWHVEPVNGWHATVAQFRAALTLGAQLARHEMGAKDDWQTLIRYQVQCRVPIRGVVDDSESTEAAVYIKDWQPYRLEAPKSWEEGAGALAGLIRDWLRWGGVGVRFWFPPKVVLVPRGLFGALALQLAFTLAGGGFLTCDGCGQPFTRKRRPRAGEGTYCPNCGPRVAAKFRQRRKRGTGNTTKP
ncbi:MAG: hypothetical protein M3256_20010 [Actinomycetota bacterium]|nr:hypothetical protein [Actinomycetota bacterium]